MDELDQLEQLGSEKEQQQPGLKPVNYPVMRKWSLFFSCLFLFAASYGQKADTLLSIAPTKEQLLKNGRTQKFIGWLMVGVGAPVVLASAYFLTFPDDVLSEKGKVALAMTGGAAFTLIGANLIKKGVKNKERAIWLGLSNQQVPLLSVKKMAYCLQPAVSVCLHF